MNLSKALEENKTRSYSKAYYRIAPKKSRVLDFLASPSDDDKYSSKYKHLAEILREFNEWQDPDRRAIVFVKERSTAKWLSQLLASDEQINSSLSPSYCIGQQGFEGMFFNEQQKPIIDNFEIGISKLLVATNVLEEGIDVPNCNLVVRFNGEMNLKSFIQAQGRARQADSKFFFIGETKSIEKYRKLESSHDVMLAAIKHVMSASLDWLGQDVIDKYIKGIQEEQQKHHHLRQQQQQFSGQMPGSDLVFRYKKLPRHDDSSIEKNLSSIFGDLQILIHPGTNLVKVSKPTEPIDDIYFEKLLPTLGENGVLLELVHASKSSKSEESTNDKIQFSSFCVGSFVKGIERFARGLELASGWVTSGDIGIKISLSVLEIEIYFASINSFSIFESISGRHVHLYIPTNVPAFLYIKEEDGGKKSRFTDSSLGENLVYSIAIPFATPEEKSSYVSFKTKLQTIRHISVFGLKFPNDAVFEQIVPASFEDFGFELFYSILSLKSRYPLQSGPGFPSQEFVNFLKNLNDESFAIILLERFVLNPNMLDSPFSNIEQEIMDYVKKTVEEEEEEQKTKQPISRAACLIKKVIITPSREIFLEPIERNTRITRKFDQPNSFIVVHFCDEDFSKLASSDHLLHNSMDIMLEKKGLKIKDKVFKFLGCSNSQLRGQSCWFTCLDREQVRDWIGDFSNITNTGKLIARMGLAFSSSILSKSIHLDKEVFEKVEEDVPSDYNKSVLFTDGIGRMSTEFSKMVCKELKLVERTTAFQIRIGGVKGVISVDPKLGSMEVASQSNIGIDHVRFRGSMKKFESDHNELEVLNYSRSLPAHLNRQIIILLSCLGVPDEVFLKLQERQISDMVMAFYKCPKARGALKQAQSFYSEFHDLVSSDFFSIQEPFISSVLGSIFDRSMSLLVDKARIRVEEGRVLMGIVDETRSLESGQVFVQYSNEDKKSHTVVTGKVVVCKNPCLHPGDIRILQAVKCDALKEYAFDCIVFPAKGDRPHPNEISGSDLDGDQYTVIWNESLIPREQYPPADYISEKSKIVDHRITFDDMAGFFKGFCINNNLGNIANYHLAQSDMKEKVWS